MGCRMSPTGALCAEGTDPRFDGHCFRCAQPIAATPQPVTILPPIRRNLDLEREIVREASRGVVDSTHLIEHAQRRSVQFSDEYVSNPLDIAPGKDRLREAREEALDGVNHCLFWLQEQDYEDDRRDDVMVSLRFFALAYDRLLED